MPPVEAALHDEHARGLPNREDVVQDFEFREPEVRDPRERGGGLRKLRAVRAPDENRPAVEGDLRPESVDLQEDCGRREDAVRRDALPEDGVDETERVQEVRLLVIHRDHV